LNSTRRLHTRYRINDRGGSFDSAALTVATPKDVRGGIVDVICAERPTPETEGLGVLHANVHLRVGERPALHKAVDVICKILDAYCAASPGELSPSASFRPILAEFWL
jgi:hypothetical protein